MASDRLWRNAREKFTWPIGATDDQGDPVDIDTVDIIFVPNTGGVRSGVTYPQALAVPVADGVDEDDNPIKVVSRLIAGPDAATGADVVLPVGQHVPWFIVTDSPEVIPRPGPRIYVG